MYDAKQKSEITRAALLGLAVGDALGVPVEFMSRKKVRRVRSPGDDRP